MLSPFSGTRRNTSGDCNVIAGAAYLQHQHNDQKNINLKLFLKMKHVKLFAMILAAGSTLVVSCDKDDDDNNYPTPNPIQSNVTSGTGDSAAVAAKFAEFRIVAGDPLNGTPNQTAGRREVNWDGVPANLTNNSAFPTDFFNNTDPAGPNGRKRGLQYANNGVQLRIDSSDFSEIDLSYAAQFEPFTRKRLLTAVGSNVLDVEFRVAGTTTVASVKSFGVVFSDVDNANSTSIEFFNGSKSLGVFKVPGSTGAGKFSFLGVQFPTEKITRAKIITGTAALAAGVKDLSDGGTNDLVTVDDFIYSEPISQ